MAARKPVAKKTETAEKKAVSYVVTTAFYDRAADGVLRKAGDVYDVAKLKKDRIDELLKAEVIKEA